jgi:sortase A
LSFRIRTVSARRILGCLAAALAAAGSAAAAAGPLPGDGAAVHPSGFHCPPDPPERADFEQAVAWIEFPRFGLLAPVYEGTEETELGRGAGLVDGTALPGIPDRRRNSVIAAHRTTYFSPLESVVPGDVLTLITGSGADEYVVDRILVVRPDRVDLERPSSSPRLTLVTCMPFNYLGSAPQRMVVIASKRGFPSASSKRTKKRTPGRASSHKASKAAVQR